MTIDLSGTSPFAKGYNRLCFRHPADPARCLKVVRPEHKEARYRRRSWLRRRLGSNRLDDNLQELKAHQQFAIKKLLARNQAKLVWEHLPRFYGTTLTTLGPANDSELILNAEGNIAPTLEKLLREYGMCEELNSAINRFLDWLHHTHILTKNLLPHNLVVTDRSGRLELFLVDGLGAPTIPQALARLPSWSEHYLRRKIQRFHQRVAWEQNGEGISWEDFQKLR